MIVFTVECTNFLDAAQVQEALNQRGIKYTYKVEKSNPQSARKRRHRPPISAKQVKDILAYIATHSDMSNVAIGNYFDIGDTVIGQIRNGVHPMCKKVR